MFRDAVEPREQSFLIVHVLEHRLDHEIAIGQRVEVERWRQAPIRASTSSIVSRPFLAVFS